jgi:hypothetical protein
MPILDAVLALTPESRDPLHTTLSVEQLQVLDIETHVHTLTDQTALYGIGVMTHPDRARWSHPHPKTLATLQAPLRQRAQYLMLLQQTLSPARVELGE